ncbi:sulfate ABC transporter permease subunit CysT [Actinoallomurus iriomotensis]|uniref:Sulfate transport system permease protein CysT n=1 Tax=Actinoallomurus iriomotensis TaxID=478107 RepID=A0A9W6S074_9ACTN|nr:sulfate ABC transporter permease subunit CysT [Actinoallomurus iriomotensis]GLY84901.1 sulfate ABC transporter permease subunit CysT [Actinoallomurus iriomotensis]
MTSKILETDSTGLGTPPGPVRPVARRRPPGAPTALGLGSAMIFLSLIVLIPLAAVLWKSAEHGPGFFWKSVTTPDAWAALKLTVVASIVVALINLVMGTLIAWVLVRDSFPGKAVLDTLIDLPFALPTIVAGLVLLELYGADSPLGINLAYTRVGVAVALLFVTLPFVVRTVQPVLLELDRDMEQAAASLGAGNLTIFRRIILPNLMPAMVSGTALAFTRSIAEFGSTVLISGNLPFKTQVAAVQIFGQIENDNTASAAAVSTALLVVAFVVLVTLDLVQRWGSRRG